MKYRELCHSGHIPKEIIVKISRVIYYIQCTLHMLDDDGYEISTVTLCEHKK